MCLLGFRTIIVKPSEKPTNGRKLGLAGAYGSTLLITFTNLVTILSFGAVVASFGGEKFLIIYLHLWLIGSEAERM